MAKPITPHVAASLADLLTGKARACRLIRHLRRNDPRTNAEVGRSLGFEGPVLSMLWQVGYGAPGKPLDDDNLLALAEEVGLGMLAPHLALILLEDSSPRTFRVLVDEARLANPDLVAWTDSLRDLADELIETLPGMTAALASEVARRKAVVADRLAERGLVEEQLAAMRAAPDFSAERYYGPLAREDRDLAEGYVAAMG
jgi:hypothetical protein